jgi:hypothetical protein
VGEFALAGEHGRDAIAPGLLDGGQDPQLVVHEHVVLGGVVPGDVVQFLLLVDVDEHLAADRLADAGALDLAWLKDDVAVRQDDRRPPVLEPLQHVQRAGKQAVREGVVHQVGRHRQQVRLVRVLDAIPLEGPEVVPVAQFGHQRLADRPVPVPARRPELPLQVPPEVVLNPVVVQQRVVHVHQEHDRVGWRHRW